MLTLLAPPKTVALEEFQADIVANISERIRHTSRPILLRSPTGSGKTLMIGRVLNDTKGKPATLWFWFVPYSNLISQTINTLQEQCLGLTAAELTNGRQYDHQAGDVLVSNVQTVASATKQREVFDSTKDDSPPSLDIVVARARTAGLKIGIVIDEAHIGVSSETEFGKFCLQLRPDRLIMASATPRDAKLNQFLAAAQYADFETFTVSRDQVVEAYLNKRYVAAVVYRPAEGWQSLADLKKTVLKHAWKQHCILRNKLSDAGIKLTPLMLVQVANGSDSIKEAHEYLVRDCGVPLEMIGTYEGRDNNPAELQRIAHNPAYQVLIFKEAAGTGFDAPRAFILTSTKTVADIDFATQFIGRIMRVARPIREFMRASPGLIDPDIETGYVYLANADAQTGFEQAAREIHRMRDKFEGAIEKLHERHLSNGATVYTNRPTNQPALPMTTGFAGKLAVVGANESEVRPITPPISPEQKGLFEDDELLSSSPGEIPRRHRRDALSGPYANADDFCDALEELEFIAYRQRADLSDFPGFFRSERRPTIANMGEVVSAVVRRLPLPSSDIERAASCAYGNVKAREVVTNLITLETDERQVLMEIDRTRLAADVQAFLSNLPQSSPADATTLIKALTQRITPDVNRWLDTVVPDENRDSNRDKRTLRDTTYLLLRSVKANLVELFNAEIAERVELLDAAPMPDAMVFPRELPLPRSQKNIYGVMPPTEKAVVDLGLMLTIDERRFLKPRTLALENASPFFIDGYDANWQMNESETTFAAQMDDADFVLWWTRNPHSKKYATAVVRADSGMNFYPDFAVCIRFWEGDAPNVRLIETKFDLADAAAKSKRDPRTYGRVIFLRSDKQRNRLILINRDGTLGDEVAPDLVALREILMQTS